MRRKKSPEDLTVEELRRLLVEKRRVDRQARLERYRRTGRVVTLAEEPDSYSLENLHTELEQESITTDIQERRSSRRKVFDRLLFLVEIAAIAGLLLLLFNGAGLIQELNQEVMAALEQPTLTPTPLIVAVVLPSGHTPPNSEGGARPNDAEIPDHLRPLVQSLASIPIPTPGPGQAIRIQIPAIGIDAPVVQGDGWEQLKKGVGQHVGTANPGQSGNLVLSAHNDIFGEIFRHLDQLKPGDEVVVYTGQRPHTYVVTSSRVVEPTAVEAMASTNDPTLTLISCYPYLVDNKRIVVKARLENP